MIRKLFIFAGGAFVLAIICIASCAAIVRNDLSNHNWTWSMVKDGDHMHFFKGPTAPPEPSITRTLAWSGDDTLVLDVPSDVTYVQGDTPGITLAGPAYLLDRVKLDGNRLSYVDGPLHPHVVSFTWGNNGIDAHGDDDDKVRITVTAPKVTHFQMTGSGDLTFQNYNQKTLDLDVSGSGDVDGTGHTDALTLHLSGNGDADLTDLVSTDAKINVSGSGDATLATTGKADVDLSGSGDVDFKTKPETVTSHISGTGSLNQD